MSDTICNKCGASDWTKLFEKDYPERRRERGRTIQTVYECESCGAFGKHFNHQDTGTEQYTAAMR